MDILEAKKIVVEAGKKLVETGLIARTWGNVSCRISDTQFVITPSGRDYISLTPDELNNAYEKFLLLADRKKDINDSDLKVIVGVNRNEAARRIRLKYLQVVCGKNSVPMATVKLNIDGEICQATSEGNGPIDAAFCAVKKLINRKIVVEEFLVQAITRGSDDVGKVHIQVENRGNLYYGFSANTDIVTASVEAFVEVEITLAALPAITLEVIVLKNAEEAKLFLVLAPYAVLKYFVEKLLICVITSR